MNDIDPIAELQDLLKDDLNAMNDMIKKMMASENTRTIPEISNHIFSAGGKKLRPLLCLATARALDYNEDKHILLAASIEFIHTATLLHDDVVDESSTRRGNKTANILWNNQSSILVGDFLFSRAFQLMVSTDSLEILEVLADTSAVIAESEVLQLSQVGNVSTSIETYMKIIEGKTAALFSAASQTGAMISSRNLEHIDNFKCYGKAIGLSFQLIDDYLDYKGSSVDMGKSIGDDFNNTKLTFPLISALKKGNSTERKLIKNVLLKEPKDPEDLIKIIRIMEKHRTLEETKTAARKWSSIANESLQKLPKNNITHLLGKVSETIVQRSS
ncbi:MAG: polyprenyl synthetase family protein [Paracoccaceae bacterium]|nr:polyprenyl synthetase family protein [Paracoccaceae bacterium]